MTDRGRRGIFIVAVVGAALAAHVFSLQNGFVDFDDDDYVFANPHVAEGLSIENMRWAFTQGHAANYHPLTWVSHQIDVAIWGLDPMGHHLTNLLLHTLNSALLFWALWRMTGRDRESLAVALLFAVHPLHVESVAWISERKDLLGACFVLLALIAYAAYVRARSAPRYLAVCAAFACALLSKPTAVTLPCLLLVLDYWPLGRVGDHALGETWPQRCRALVAEKAPLFALTLLACAVTYIVQREGGAMDPLYRLSLTARIENAVIAYIRYIEKLAWPFDLSPIYPLPAEWPPVWVPGGAALALIAITVAMWKLRARASYALVGWLWFLGTLVPAIGIVRVGFAAMADRYMYLPMVGLLVAGVWGASAVLRARGSERLNSAATALGCVLIAWLASRSHAQTAVWRNSETLFTHAIAVTRDNAEAYAHLGVAYLRQDRPADAVAPLETAVKICPELAAAHTSLGVAYRMTGQPERAVQAHEAALRIDPDQAGVHANLGIALIDLGRYADAERHLRQALALDPHNTSARDALARIVQSAAGTLP